MDKQTIRERVWDALEASGEARFPFPPHGRIPNFAGAREAAERLAATDAWERADVVKANPDAPQLPVRRRALREGKTVYMAVPRLRDERPFMELDPDTIPADELDSAPTVSSAASYARQVGLAEMPAVDLVVSGSVAVTEDGARVGKGEGYSDLEYALLRERGLLSAATPVATTVHEPQVVDDAPVSPHDVPMDLVVTPGRVVETETPHERPAGVDRAALTEAQLAEIPVLSER
ncbi:MAG: 5-formyltetrahydrofolate cyclo-ligase [Haloarculaceae archaeon]